MKKRTNGAPRVGFGTEQNAMKWRDHGAQGGVVGESWHAGEASPISVVRTEARQPNSSLGTIAAR